MHSQFGRRALDARPVRCVPQTVGLRPGNFAAPALRANGRLETGAPQLPRNADANVRRPLGEAHVGLLRPQGHALDGALLGARLAEHGPGRRQYGHVRVAPDARHRHALQPVQRRQPAGAVRQRPRREGAAQRRQPDGERTHAERNLRRRGLGRDVPRLQAAGRLGICAGREFHEPAPLAHDHRRRPQIRLSAGLHPPLAVVGGLQGAERLLRPPVTRAQPGRTDERHPRPGTDHDDLALLLLCHERPPLHGDRQRIPAFRHHARKGAGGIRPGLGEHHQGSRLGQGR